MRHPLLWLYAGLFLCAGLTLPVRAQDSRPPPEKYWIFLQDKAGPPAAAAAKQTDVVSARAQARRALRGRTLPADLDAPLSDRYLRQLAEAGVAVHLRSRWLNAVSAPLTPERAAAVRQLPFVRDVRPVGKRVPPSPVRPEPPSGTGAPPGKRLQLDYGPSYTQLALMNAVAPLERGIDGRGVRLGFLDTEYGDFAHPVFDRLRTDGRLLGHCSFAPTQWDRHGLAVASTAVGFAPGELIGPAHGAQVLAATTEYAPTETNAEEDAFVAGLEWLEAQGADVVNTSLGYTTFDAGERSYTPADLDGDTGVTTAAVDIAAALGVVVVVSAGNEGICSSPESCWYYIGTPADADSAIAVGAVRSDSTRAPFSSFGPTADGRIKPDVAAMGWNVRIAAEGGGYSYASGTSFSSPLAAGVAAQMLQVNPALTPIAVRDILRATASQSQHPDSSLGWGIIDAEAAVREAEVRAQPGAALPDGPVLECPPEAELPDTLTAGAFHPNPFTDRTTFTLQVPRGNAGPARLTLYNALGQRVAVPFDGRLTPGENRVEVELPHLAPGLYLYVGQGRDVFATGTLVKLR